MEAWKEKLATQVLPDLKDQRIRELELEVGRLLTENKNLRGRLSTREKQLMTRDKEKDQLQHSRHLAVDRRGHTEALLDAAQAEIKDLKRRLDRIRRALAE